jgi:Rrf2 family protein
MILSRTSQYAIQALIYLATRPRGELILRRELAQHLNLPPTYLAKILGALCNGGLLYSTRGRRGGFCLRENVEHADLLQVLCLTEGASFSQGCVLGLKDCADDSACPMHCDWKPIKARIVRALGRQTLHGLAKGIQSGKYRLADLPMALLVAAEPGAR